MGDADDRLGRAEQTAVRIADRSPAPSAELDDWNPPIEQIEQQIDDVTGLRSVEGTATAELIDRPAWIRANLTSFEALLAPVLSKLEEQRPKSGLGAGTMGSLSRQMAGVQLGTLLGWMGTRVLGQYDLLVRRTDATSDGAVYLVGPNLASLEQRFGFEPHEFRTWVLVHELTHRAQFTGVPWMRDHYTGLVDGLLQAIDPRPDALLAALRDAWRRPDDARQQVRETGIAGADRQPRAARRDRADRRADVAAGRARRRDDDPRRRRPRAHMPNASPGCSPSGASGAIP